MKTIKQLFAIATLGLLTFTANAQTWTWSQLQTSNNIPANFQAGRGAVDYTHGLIYSAQQISGQAGSLIVYNMASNTFTTLPSAGWPGEIRGDCYVYDSTNNRILGWQDGRTTVYAIPATGGTWQSLGGGSQSYSDWGNNKWWNPMSGKVNTFAGYGFGAFHNWVWEFNPSNGSWNQLIANTPGSASMPWPRYGAWGQTFDAAKSRLFIYAGEGNSSGNQYQLDSGIPAWNSDGDMLQDLWMLNLTNQQWTVLIPETKHLSPPLAGEIVYFPPNDSIFQIYSASPTMATNLVMRFGLSDGSTNFSIIQTIGNKPPIVNSVNGLLPVYNSAAKNIICFLPAGVYALSLGPTVGLSYAVRPTFSNLAVGTNYQLQVSTSLTGTFTNSGTPFTATTNSMAYPQYFDVANWNQLFFRLQVP